MTYHVYHCDYRDRLQSIIAQFGKPDCMVMDPPYKFNPKGGGEYQAARSGMKEIAQKGLDQGFDLELLSWKYANSIMVFCHNDQLGEIIMRLKQGFHRVVVLMLHKKNPQPVHNRNYQPDTEFFVHAWQQSHYPLGDLVDKKRFITCGRPEKFDHPTVKPLEVMRKIMKNVHGDLIFDPFMGTGSTGVAAVEAGKTFIGCEIDQDYFEIAQTRLDLEICKQVAFGAPS